MEERMHDKSFDTHKPRMRVVRDMNSQNCVRAYRSSPETVEIQIRLEGRFVNASLNLETAKALGAHLQTAAGQVADEAQHDRFMAQVRT
jgi:23S rRNA A2030 N6-methylase RlmJ